MDILYLSLIVVLAAAILTLRAFARNTWIRRRLRGSFFLLVIALLLDLTRVYGRDYISRPELFWTAEILIISMAVVVAAVVLVFNRFHEGMVSQKHPSIVQDALVIGVFLVIVAYMAPDKFVTTSAVGALVIGLALQDTLGNLFSGLALQIEKPFFVGDWVKVANLEGKVVEVTWRATKILTKSGHHCVIPNTVISKDLIVNYTQPSPVLRMQKKVGFGYEVPPNKIKEVVLGAIAEIPEILSNPAPDVLLDTYNDFSIDYLCRFWIRDFSRSEPIMDRFTTLLYYRLARAGLQIPFPIRDVRVSEKSRGEVDFEQELALRNRFLDGVDLFAGLEKKDRSRIAEGLQRITFAAQESVVRKGQPGESMFFIEGGKVRVLAERDGLESVVAVLEDGQYFGEMSLLTGEPRTATVQAVTDVRAFVLSKGPFREVLQEHPDVAEAVSQVIAERRQSLEQKTAALESDKAVKRIKESIFRKIQSFFGL